MIKQLQLALLILKQVNSALVRKGTSITERKSPPITKFKCLV